MMLRGPRVNRSACGISESVPLSFYGLGFFDSSLLPLRCIDGIGLSPDLRSQDLPPISRSPPRPCSSLCTVLSSCAYCARECHLLMYVRASVTRWSILASRPYVRASVTGWSILVTSGQIVTRWSILVTSGQIVTRWSILVTSWQIVTGWSILVTGGQIVTRWSIHILVTSDNECHWLVYSCNKWAEFGVMYRYCEFFEVPGATVGS
jgi:hypothetical protein